MSTLNDLSIPIPGSLLAPATPSQSGAMSAAQVVSLNAATAALAGDWYAKTAKWVADLGLAPGITDWRAMVEPWNSEKTFPTNTAPVDVDGGAMRFSNAAFTYFSRNIIQNPKTAQWAVAFDAKIPAPVTAKEAYLGIGQNGANPKIVIGVQYAKSVNNRTNLYALYYTGGADEVVDMTYAVDGQRHTYVIAGDTTQTKIAVDGVLVHTHASLTQVPVTATQLVGYCTSGYNLDLYRAMVGTVG
jgi:hypothetical protein